MNTRLGFNLN